MMEDWDWKDAGNGVQWIVEDDFLYTRTSVSDSAKSSAHDSKSGKTKVLGTTGGFISVGNGVKIGLNITYKE